MSQNHNRQLSSNIAQIELNYIGKVLSNNTRGIQNKIQVPLYQRPYTWKKDKVSVLFEDLLLHDNERAENAYYLGQLVFVSHTDRIEILDGQQRLTTLYIFVNAILNALEKLRKEIKDHPTIEQSEIETWEENIDEEINLIYGLVIKNHGEWKKGAYTPKKERGTDNIIESEIKFLPFYEDDQRHFNFLFKPKSIIDFDTVRQPYTGPNQIYKRHKIIAAAFTMFENIEDQTDKIVHHGDDQIFFQKIFNKLLSMKNYVLGEFAEVSYTILQPGIEFTIFETLNSRGEDLNCYDLTRNLMINISKKGHINKERETLNAFEKDIRKNCSPKKNFDERMAIKLMLASWNMSNEGKASAGKYMKDFIDFVKDQRSTEGGFQRTGVNMADRFENYLNKLKNCSYSYAELLNPETKIKDKEDWGTQSKREDLWKRMFLFKKTKATQHYPMYLALRFRGADIDTVIKYQELIEKVYVNFILLSKKSPSLIETEMSKMAYEIYSSDDISQLYTNHLSNIKNLAKNNKIKLDEFEKDFSDLTANNSVSTFLMLNIVLNKGLPIDITSPELTLEHVLPETAEFTNHGQNWYNENFLETSLDPLDPLNKKLNDEAHKLYLDRVGNHTILKNKDNIANSNKAYADKKPIYKKYGTDEITKGATDLAVLNFLKWDASAIEKRQKALAAQAKKIWAFTNLPAATTSTTGQPGNQTQG